MLKSILWIEDDADIIGGLMVPLEKTGLYKIDIVESMAEYKQIEDTIMRSYDLIILDLILPSGHADEVIDMFVGIEILKDIRTVRNLKTPVLVLTVVSNGKVHKAISELEVEDILAKPILPSVLKDKIEFILRKT